MVWHPKQYCFFFFCFKTLIKQNSIETLFFPPSLVFKFFVCQAIYASKQLRIKIFLFYILNIFQVFFSEGGQREKNGTNSSGVMQ